MFISVVVVAYNEEKNIGECISSLVDQDYPKTEYEILIVDGNSTDKTREIVKDFQKTNTNIRLVNNPKRTIASNRNVGICESKYDYILFTDADCIVPKEWISKLVYGFKDLKEKNSDLVAVGGGNITPQGLGNFNEAIGIAIDTLVGSFGSTQGKIYNIIKEVDSLACLNVLYDKKKLNEINGFDENLGNVGEDWDVNFRLREKNYKMFILPGVEVFHKMRPNVKKFWKQMYGYGYGRAKIIKKAIKTLNIMYVLPLLFILGMAGSLFGLFNKIMFIPLIYFPAICIISLYNTIRKNRVDLLPYTILVFFIIHFGYGIGELKGLISKKN